VTDQEYWAAVGRKAKAQEERVAAEHWKARRMRGLKLPGSFREPKPEPYMVPVIPAAKIIRLL
jgi:hypothetical protein